ncbi:MULTISPECIES: hypothetical protein [Ramlibacter]|uniref:ParB/Sulfiredoxin domain-containing protein n=1 Tax=Ramlibacter aquaticus TaxID=2780094 RepID=A0ABR9SHT9_9BURK|nr:MULTISPECIES: hypothetical protein [Ramlibacter]MBE7941883.1 hypothetical protein [Ramlibacter aquaticus]
MKDGGNQDRDIKWMDDVDPDDFESARRYLALVFAPRQGQALTHALEQAPLVRFPAKDVLRASGQQPKSGKDPDVARQARKIARGKALSPVLLVRVPNEARVLVADGYHRVCAAYLHNEDEPVPCKIA